MPLAIAGLSIDFAVFNQKCDSTPMIIPTLVLCFDECLGG